MNPFFRSLMDEYNLYFLNITTFWINKHLNENEYDHQQLIQESITILLIYKQILLKNDELYSIDDYYKIGTTQIGESLYDTALPVTSYIHDFLCDIEGIGP